MPAPRIGVTLTFTLSTSTPTQLSTGGFDRRGFMISNGDTANAVSIGFGTNNSATAVPPMHLIPAGGRMIFGDFPIGDQPGRGASHTLSTDISAIAVSGSPAIAFSEW